MQPAFSPPPPPVVTEQMVRPSKWWFVAAALVAVAGIVAAIVIVVLGAVDYAERIENFDRADVPGTLEVEITRPGGYSVYHEYGGAFDDFTYVREPTVTVTDPSGAAVGLDTYDSVVTYATSDYDGEGLFTFEAEEAGTYLVAAEGSSGSGVAVGRGLGRGLTPYVAGSVVVGLLGVVAGTVIAIVVGVKRSQSRRALRPVPAFGGWGPAPVWGGPPGPVGSPPGWGGQPSPPSPYAPPGSPGPPGSPAPGTAPAGWGGPPAPPPV
jgi:hypothetical protein